MVTSKQQLFFGGGIYIFSCTPCALFFCWHAVLFFCWHTILYMHVAKINEEDVCVVQAIHCRKLMVVLTQDAYQKENQTMSV